MFEHFTTLQEIFHYKLGSALTMEYDSLDMLEDMENAVMRSDLKELFHGHAAETRRQIENLHNCFALLGEEVHRQSSPTTKGLTKEAKSIIGKTDNMLVDAVVLAGALEAEHHATAVYEALLILTKASGATGVAELLSENLEQQKATIEKIKAALHWIARADAEDQESRTEEEAEQAEKASKPVVPVPGYLPPGTI
ncbi:DUF892 family protein [Arthrobacter sp. H35-D1]|uniref:YciE/YciF ferroxidase family protein n=1 Tax=Arthrobacter sp. H35-D1 TaxID=3046202 RepID=UPI0024BA90FD|nr:DUF892 family protein [Arthrobacter sp. H35-D1]MDJ0313632.1 DUF892 family protein [Arthrobacter sp. H35-D1]